MTSMTPSLDDFAGLRLEVAVEHFDGARAYSEGFFHLHGNALNAMTCVSMADLVVENFPFGAGNGFYFDGWWSLEIDIIVEGIKTFPG